MINGIGKREYFYLFFFSNDDLPEVSVETSEKNLIYLLIDNNE